MTVELSRVGDYALITLNRPEALNALSFQIIRQLGEAFDEVAGGDARALIITGAGDKAFCAGADIQELMDRSLVAQKRGAELGQRTFAKLDSLPVPSIALINGYAFGGGLEMALACTFRLVTPAAKLGLPEVKLGLIPGYGGTQRLPRLIGQGRALEMILSAETIDAEKALRIGLANHIVEAEGALEAAQQFAGRFARFSLPVIGCARQAVQRAQDVSLEEGLRMEADLSTLAYQTEDSVEGMAAFAEKRSAQFKDH
ncbi:enoyl-CoA hydratase/isomerase family protein [Halomonas sp. HK25]|uniref:enoyl-CoA hydratase/isomerase family protein n=1 Tax=Halomonas sp. HK25 TaxID=3394321 RepID=UPI0039FD8DB8